MKIGNARAILRENGLTPKKGFGQNFLVTEGVVLAIARACVTEAEVGHARVLEIGAGLGALTALLLERSSKLVAVERDRDLVPVLKRTFAEPIAEGRIVLLEADAQTLDLPALLGDEDAASPRILCGNLPYQITGRLLEAAVNTAAHLERAVFMVQDEVADRLLSRPATKEYGALTVFVRAAFDVKRVCKVSPGSFFPSPDVTSSVVTLTPTRPRRAHETPAFRTLVRAAFQMRRKTLRNAWHGVFPSPEALEVAAKAAGVSLQARGETLDVDDFARMAAQLGAPDAAQLPS